MKQNIDNYTDHEVRIRLLESIASNIDKDFKHLESKMSGQFHWIMGTLFLLVLTILGLFGSIALHTLKLI